MVGTASRQHRSLENCGCGLMLRISEDGELVVDGLLAGGPADKTGKLRLGDTLVRVDRQYVHGLQPAQIAPKILGPAGSIVELGFKRSQGPVVLTVNVAIVRGLSPFPASLTDAPARRAPPDARGPASEAPDSGRESVSRTPRAPAFHPPAPHAASVTTPASSARGGGGSGAGGRGGAGDAAGVERSRDRATPRWGGASLDLSGVSGLMASAGLNGAGGGHLTQREGVNPPINDTARNSSTLSGSPAADAAQRRNPWGGGDGMQRAGGERGVGSASLEGKAGRRTGRVES